MWPQRTTQARQGSASCFVRFVHILRRLQHSYAPKGIGSTQTYDITPMCRFDVRIKRNFLVFKRSQDANSRWSLAAHVRNSLRRSFVCCSNRHKYFFGTENTKFDVFCVSWFYAFGPEMGVGEDIKHEKIARHVAQRHFRNAGSIFASFVPHFCSRQASGVPKLTIFHQLQMFRITPHCWVKRDFFGT